MKKIILSVGVLLAAAAVFANVQNKTTEDKPWRVFMLGDAQNLTATNKSEDTYYERGYEGDNDFGAWENQSWTNYNHVWVAGLGGSGSEYNDWQEFDWDWQYITNTSTRSMTGDMIWDWSGWGGEIGTSGTSNHDGTNTTGFTNTLSIFDKIGNEHCNVSDPVNTSWDNTNSPWWVYSDAGSEHDTYTRTADTVWHVQTGGKAMPGRQNLWQFSASAWEILDKRAVPPFYGAAKREITDKTQIVLKELGALKADGNLWLTLPDDVEKDVTPMVANKDFYTFWPDARKYKPYVSANTTNLSTNTPEFCVGQYVTFAVNWDSTPPGIIDADTISHWTLPAKYVNESWQQTTLTFNQPYGSINYRVNSSLLQNTNQTSCWFYNGQGGMASIGMNLHFSNGQYVSIAAAGNFTIYRPTFSGFHNDDNGFSPFPTYIPLLGVPIPYLRGNMTWRVTLNSKYDGLFGVTQLLNANGGTYDTGGANWLDGSSEIYGTATNGPDDYVATNNPIFHETTLDDHPRAPALPDCATMQASFTDYLRFQPSGANSIYVTIAENGWYMDGAACLVGGVTRSNLPPASACVNLDDFPVWTGVRPGD